jgi:ubiquinone/menaquinone biosynthesis C-methylase UbiE
VADKPSGFFEGTEMPTAGWWEALWPDPAFVVRAVGILPGMTVVDLCSGDGWFTLQIAKVARRVIAIDIDSQLLDLSRHRLAESGIRNVDFAAGNAYRLRELVPNNVDFAFMANAFHGVPDKPRLVQAISAVLRPGGRFAVVNWHQRPREETTILGEPRGPKTELRLSPEQTIDSVAVRHLKFVARLEIPPYHYAVVFARPQTSGASNN